jgi:uncharacterized protein YjbJ (UPF0337 family)
MSKNADEIRSEIEETRGAMGDTLEALGDRVAPKKVTARAKAEVADKVDEVRHRLSPGGALRRTTSRLRDSLQGDKATSNGSAGDDTRRSRSALTDAPRKLADRTGSASQSLTEQAAGNPLAIGLLAFGAGMVAAGLLPPTDREREVAGRVKERVEPLKDQALEAGRSIMGELKPAAQASIEQVKDRALGAVEQVKGEAKGATEELKQGAQTASGQVKQTTRAASGRVRSEAKRSTAAVKGEAKESARAAKQAAGGRASSGPRSTRSSAASRPRTARAAGPTTTASAPKRSRSPRRAASAPTSTGRAG